MQKELQYELVEVQFNWAFDNIPEASEATETL